MDQLTISQSDLRKLFTVSGEAVKLYIYVQSGNAADTAGAALNLSDTAISCAAAVLRQLGLWPEDRRGFIPSGERPAYSEEDVIRAMDSDMDFRSLYGEVQRLLGKALNTEEMKILLGFVRYLGMSGEVVCVLITYCKDKARQKGSLRSPSLRSIEKEAYHWAEQGIDTIEEASAYIQAQNLYRSRLGRLMQQLQIRGRNLTAGEERYAKAWLDMGFEEAAITMAYERTCLNTGGMNWAYMNKILTRWHESGWHTVNDIKARDRKQSIPKGASGELGQAELEAIQRVLQEG